MTKCLLSFLLAVASLPAITPITVEQLVRQENLANQSESRAHRKRTVSAQGIGFRETRNLANTPTRFTIRLLNLASGVTVSVFDDLKLKTSIVDASPRAFASMMERRISQNCLGTYGTFVRNESLNGIPVAYFEQSSPTYSLRAWVHIPSGCTEIKSIHEWRNSVGTPTARTTYEPTNIQLGYADPDLLAITSDLYEASPLQVNQAIANKFPQFASPPNPHQEEIYKTRGLPNNSQPTAR
jgi:hypothetical protein